MATLIKPNGESTTVSPANGKHFKLEEFYKHIGCDTVQCIDLPDGRTMWLDEDGKSNDKLMVNSTATKLLSLAGGIDGDQVVGTVLLLTVEETAADREVEDEDDE